jgi:spore germination cell wall hydrolase CwlJ-like protein
MSKTAAAILCDHFYLALAVWREARGESAEGQVAVACSIINRVANPKWWGTTVDEVITKRWQYSSLTDPKDPQVSRSWPTVKDPSWLLALGVAHDVLEGGPVNPMPGADSYHDSSISPPFWTTKSRYCGKIGRLFFYDVDHDYEKEKVT